MADFRIVALKNNNSTPEQSRSDMLQVTFMKWNTLSGIALLVLVPCILALYFRHSLFGTGPVTIAVQVAAALLMVWARLTFGIRSFHGTANPTAGGLVTSGPYRYFRHPIYAAILYFIWAAAAAHFSVLNAGVAVLATIMLATRMLAEEALLTATYPEYKGYSRTTKRVVPFLF
jgi:protein-S-isoprenylcysteine O-methyltransferase Ste14